MVFHDAWSSSLVGCDAYVCVWELWVKRPCLLLRMMDQIVGSLNQSKRREYTQWKESENGQWYIFIKFRASLNANKQASNGKMAFGTNEIEIVVYPLACRSSFAIFFSPSSATELFVLGDIEIWLSLCHNLMKRLGKNEACREWGFPFFNNNNKWK